MTAVSLSVHVQPRAGKTEIVGWHGEAVKIRLKSPPVDGAANDELVRFLSKTIRVPQSAVRITGGAKSRRKEILVEGIGRSDLMTALGI